MNKRHYILLLFFLLFVGIIQSCSEEQVIEPKEEEKEIDITISFVTGRPSTRAMDVLMENEIKEIDVLVFSEGLDGKEAFSYRAEGKQITGNGAEKEFKVTLMKNASKKYRLVVIANAKESFNSISLEGEKDEIMRKLEFSQSGKWPANLDGQTDNYRVIPMWGESGFVIIDENLANQFSQSPILLYRALARIDLQLDNNVNNFRMTGIYLYNYNTKGCVAPNKDADWDEHPYEPGELRVRNVSLPQNTGHVQTPPLYYPVTGNFSEASIYTFEAEKAAKGDYNNATCLIMEGIYGSNADTDRSYYRIDFRIVWNVYVPDPEGPGGRYEEWDEGGGGGFVGSARTFPHILRNHVYDITVTDVTSEGYKSADDAFRRTAQGLELQMNIWTNKEINPPIEDYILNVEPGIINYQITSTSPDVYVGEINIQTDAPGGWDYTIVSGSDWLIATKGDNNKLIFNILKNNISSSVQGTIKIKAGKIEKDIAVKVTR